MADVDGAGTLERLVDSGPAMVVVCGLPGVGKTTVARDVAERADGELFRTDVVRKELFPDPAYTEEEAAAVYRELLDRAREALARGDVAVLDGTFHDRAERDRAFEAADAEDAAARLVKVESTEATVRERIEEREGDESDADFEVHRTYREAFDPLDRDHVTVDNSGSLAATYRQVDEQF